MLIKPIGAVHSSIATTREMPHRGSSATVEVFPEYEDGLLGIEDSSHIVVISWMHAADRRALRLDKVGPENLPLLKGVFSLRSPSRPNPLGISATKLLKVEGRNLFLERLDLIDGTPVIDIKSYSLGWDTVFAPRGFWDMLPLPQRDPNLMLDLLRAQAFNFHGRSCRGLLMGVKMVFDVARRWNISPRNPGLRFELGNDGCIADAVQGTTGATLGNGRLTCHTGSSWTAILGQRALRYEPVERIDVSDDEILLTMDVSSMFTIAEGSAAAVSGSHQGRCGGGG
ncbi:MAG: tRNA (N6-threonylcarbamoyladenosine(37)-N6)-methyltransferase TrmO [Chloroflexi bacterium]|nr:tRNA (N6-threonylcarbamoyladenosine(37)-N6)-methyltransferase TrmO [Chloroflexota bacterium]